MTNEERPNLTKEELWTVIKDKTRALQAHGKTIDELHAKLADARRAALEEAANWLRRNANAEQNHDKRAAFIEASNALRVLSDRAAGAT